MIVTDMRTRPTIASIPALPADVPVRALHHRPRAGRVADQSRYVILNDVARDGPQNDQDYGPMLAETTNYRDFYAAGQGDHQRLPGLTYAILHTFRPHTSFTAARAAYFDWRRAATT